MNNDISYKAAYERQKKAREHAEHSLEMVSRELYESHSSLLEAFNSLKEHRAQLLHQEKLASIGQLSAGVAHEINNPAGYALSNLNCIDGYIKTIRTYCNNIESVLQSSANNNPDLLALIKKCKDDLELDFVFEDITDALSDSKQGLERIQSIVISLQGFARQDSKNKEEMCLNECIENTLKLVQSELNHKAELHLSLGDLPRFKGRSGELSQVILNLLTNAIDAIEDNGLIKIATDADEKYVNFSIEDTGSGVSEEKIDKIFDPFYTTKEEGKGTGLGLSISHSIIAQHNGELIATSREGEGTTFRFTIPHDQVSVENTGDIAV